METIKFAIDFFGTVIWKTIEESFKNPGLGLYIMLGGIGAALITLIIFIIRKLRNRRERLP